ncbi:LysR family transcriptional regulator [Streptomyces sp. NPDC055955]|uniref:LysR family transcriptional regulator n=1 Tax=Streptomyces sp. NPDC055955 TaxID=3345665 RepID=UPI0035E24975
MPDFTLRQLEYFAEVASSGSLAKAAQELRVSRSALAAGIDSLEAAVGRELFHRQRAVGVTLTPAGEQFLDGALSLLRSATNLRRRTSEEAINGELNVGAVVTLAPVVLPPIIDRLAREHPNLRVRATTRPAEELLQLLHDGNLEVIANYTGHRDRTLSSLSLFEGTMTALLAADHPLAQNSEIDVADIADEPLVVVDNPRNREELYRYFERHRISPNIRYRVTSVELSRALVARKIGISLAVTFPTHQLSHEGLPFVSRPLRPRPQPLCASLVWPRERALSEAAQAFIEAALMEGD